MHIHAVRVLGSSLKLRNAYIYFLNDRHQYEANVGLEYSVK